MFNWISPFNYDFALAAIPIQIILLVFYGVRRNLPIRQSSCFWLVTSYFSILSILIIYLTSENPDLYRDSRTRLMNREADEILCRRWFSWKNTDIAMRN